MKKQRFRDVKQGKVEKKEPTSVKPKRAYARASTKIKAFLTDSFMLMMPILYVVVYLVMGGREGFAEHIGLGWVYIFVPLVIVQTIFMVKTAQTPGYRAYDLQIIDEKTGEKPSFMVILFRNICAVLTALMLIGWMFMFFRKDRKSIHDLLSRTAIVDKR
jgi:uncharacterized RDD family membrane protein YckC